MQSVMNLINKHNIIQKNSTIGVAVSGGMDSMCLLHFLNKVKNEIGFKIVVINIDHNIRESSKDDSQFVKTYCNNNNILCLCYKVEALKNAEDKKIGIEESARELRYQVFKKLLQDGVVTKIALGHHKQDQVETVLLNLFRGTGLSGAAGMKIENNGFIRPLLNTSKLEIQNYVKLNNISYVEDETNLNTDYSRNYLRHEIIPNLKKYWNGLEDSIVGFAKICREDDDFILSQINFDNIVIDDTLFKIPLSYFSVTNSIINRVLKYGFEKINLQKDIEKKHFELIKNLAQKGKNGDKLTLPHNLEAIREYLFLTISKKPDKKTVISFPFVLGKQKIFDYIVEILKTEKMIEKQNGVHFFDLNKIPSNAVWRFRKTGDIFKRFGGGTKKLNDYFIDQKIPTRLRNTIPLLCSKTEVLIILNNEISDTIKIDNKTTEIGKITINL